MIIKPEIRITHETRFKPEIRIKPDIRMTEADYWRRIAVRLEEELEFAKAEAATQKRRADIMEDKALLYQNIITEYDIISGGI